MPSGMTVMLLSETSRVVRRSRLRQEVGMKRRLRLGMRSVSRMGGNLTGRFCSADSVILRRMASVSSVLVLAVALPADNLAPAAPCIPVVFDTGALFSLLGSVCTVHSVCRNFSSTRGFALNRDGEGERER